MELFSYNKRVKVSLLILAYNEESFIEEIVKKYNHYFESLIVVNDCSTDNTSTNLSDLSESNKNIVLSTNNLKNAIVKKVDDINTYDIVNADSVLFVEDSIKKLNEILK